MTGMRHASLATIATVFIVLSEAMNATAQTSQPPVSDAAFVQSSGQSLISSLHLRGINLQNPVELQLKETMVGLDQVAGFVTPVWVCNGCGTSSHPALGIIVDVDQLQKITRQSHLEQFPIVLAFFLGHEKTHQIQYLQYSQSIITSPISDRQAYEAQADILGGKYLIESMPSSLTPAQIEAITESLRVAYSLGVEQYAIADHPSQYARLTAVRLGMAAGMITRLLQLGGAPAQESAQILVRKIDMRPGESVLAWSLRMARRVVNYQRPAVVDLVLSKETINWDKSAAKPIVSYEVTYQNRGVQDIALDVEIQCVSAPRDNRDDVMRWQKVDANNFSFSLKPQETKVLSGTMHWVATADLMPIIVTSPDPTALIDVHYAGNSKGALASAAGRALNLDTNAAYRSSFTSVLGRILAESGDNFRSLRAGPGKLTDDDVVYAIDPQFPGSKSTDLWVPEPESNDDVHVISRLIETDDSSKSKQTFQQATIALRTALQSLGQWSERTRTVADGSMLIFSRGTIRIALSNRYVHDRYRITLLISKESPS